MTDDRLAELYGEVTAAWDEFLAAAQWLNQQTNHLVIVTGFVGQTEVSTINPLNSGPGMIYKEDATKGSAAVRDQVCATCRYFDAGARHRHPAVVSEPDDDPKVELGLCRRRPESYLKRSLEWCGEWRHHLDLSKGDSP